VNRVGSESTTGDGLFGQADMAGNVAEWVQDWWANSNTYTNPCDNCSYFTPGLYRVHLGGSFYDNDAHMLTANRNGDYPTKRDDGIGMRCVRSP
jgi:formylglycine-generating enzyme required for sulfatase activity